MEESSKLKITSSKTITEAQAARIINKFIEKEEDFLERHKDFPQDVFEHLKVFSSELSLEKNHVRDVRD